MQTDEYWTVKDFCNFIKSGKSTVWDGVNKGRFPKPVKIGGLTRWKRSEVEACIAGMAAQRSA